MKHLTILAIAVFITTISNAQTKNPSSNKEVQAKIKQAQQQLDKLTPEQKKMMEQMGMSTNIPSMPGGVTDTDVKSAVGSGLDIQPKNATLIAAIPKITITASNLPGYLSDVNKYINDHLSLAGKSAGEKFYTGLKKANSTTQVIANTATGLWANGELEPAVYMLGKICADDIKNTDNISNFTAMLSMSGAPHLAIPMLDYLNKLYPGNTTILNNLGQAWFHLGMIEKADTYLQQTIKAFAYHPQANQTECLIQQSKGSTAKAVEYMKNSLKYSYSLDKINTLRKLGYKVKGSDIRNPFQPDPNPLGLRDFIRPGFPKNYAEEVQLKFTWDDFEKKIESELTKLNAQLQPYINNNAQKALDAYKKMGDVNGKVTVSSVSKMTTSAAAPTRLYEQNAQRNLEDMSKDGGSAYRLKTMKLKIDSLTKRFVAEKELKRKEIERKFSLTATEESELAKKGENIGYDNCKVQQAYSNWVHTTYNQPLEEAEKEYLHQLRIKIEEELYWKQFVQDDATFAATQIAAKKEWLAALSNRYLSSEIVSWSEACNVKEADESKTTKLADFDDMNCKYHTSLDLGFGNSIETHCSKMNVNFNGGPLSGNLNYKTDNTGHDRFVKGTLEATVFEKSIGAGPLQAGVKAGMGMEFTPNGIEDVYATGEASVVNVTASGKISLMSGSMTGGITGFGK